MNETTRSVYTVQGMTCDHCRASVVEEVSEIAGVESVEVDLASGRLEIGGAGVRDGEIKAAVEGAGYRLADER